LDLHVVVALRLVQGRHGRTRTRFNSSSGPKCRSLVAMLLGMTLPAIILDIVRPFFA